MKNEHGDIISLNCIKGCHNTNYAKQHCANFKVGRDQFTIYMFMLLLANNISLVGGPIETKRLLASSACAHNYKQVYGWGLLTYAECISMVTSAGNSMVEKKAAATSSSFSARRLPAFHWDYREGGREGGRDGGKNL